MRTDSCTWLAAMPAPLAARIVSIVSSISCWISGEASSSRISTRVGWRSTGCPTVAILRTVTRSSALGHRHADATLACDLLGPLVPGVDVADHPHARVARQHPFQLLGGEV